MRISQTSRRRKFLPSDLRSERIPKPLIRTTTRKIPHEDIIGELDEIEKKNEKSIYSSYLPQFLHKWWAAKKCSLHIRIRTLLNQCFLFLKNLCWHLQYFWNIRANWGTYDDLYFNVLMHGIYRSWWDWGSSAVKRFRELELKTVLLFDQNQINVKYYRNFWVYDQKRGFDSNSF